jgi:hypothetical protein
VFETNLAFMRYLYPHTRHDCLRRIEGYRVVVVLIRVPLLIFGDARS